MGSNTTKVTVSTVVKYREAQGEVCPLISVNTIGPAIKIRTALADKPAGPGDCRSLDTTVSQRSTSHHQCVIDQ